MDFIRGVERDLEKENEEWTPGFGKPYFREPKFYQSPKVKDVDLKEDRVNVAKPIHRQFTRYYTNDEILDIWAKPLEGFEVTDKERELIKKYPSFVNVLNTMTEESPCRSHILNMFLDRCQNPDVGRDPKTMLQHTACNYHWFRFMKCISKHFRWYEARRDALRDALPEEQKAMIEPVKKYTRFDVDPYEFYEDYQDAKE